MKVSKILFYGITAVAILGAFVIFKAKEEGVFNQMLAAEKLPKFLSFLEKKA